MSDIARYKSKAEWATSKLVLRNGEPGFEDDTGKLKIGDGQSLWNALPYVEGIAPYTLPPSLSPVFHGGTPGESSAGTRILVDGIYIPEFPIDASAYEARDQRRPTVRVAALEVTPRQLFVNDDWKTFEFNKVVYNTDPEGDYFTPMIKGEAGGGNNRSVIRINREGVYLAHWNVTFDLSLAPTIFRPSADPRKLVEYNRSASLMKNKFLVAEGNSTATGLSQGCLGIECDPGDLIWIVAWVEAEAGETVRVVQSVEYQTGFDLTFLGAK